MNVGDTITCTIEKNVYGGDGLARVDGMVVFVQGAFKGDTVEARIVQVKKRFAKAIASYPEIPGMVYADTSNENEIAFKCEQLEDFLKRIPHPAVEVVAGTGFDQYRNKVVYHVDEGRIGYRREPEHKVVDVLFDPLARPEINEELELVRSEVMELLRRNGDQRRRRDPRDGEANVTIRWTRHDGVVWWLGRDCGRQEPLIETTCGLDFEVAPHGFYQVNPEVDELLVAAVRDAYLEGAARAPDILDLYCGVGVFGIVCAKAANVPPRLCGVESVKPAIESSKRNASANGVRGNFFCERVGGSLGRIKVTERTTVIVDPPRGGLEPNVAPWLAKCGAPRIFYVSCDPATLTRDLEAISQGYDIRRVRLYNMFPRTARFETFVELVRR